MKDIETVIEKVNRLMALAEDTAASDNEIELAYARAQKLIDEYRLENWRRDDSSRNQTVVEHTVHVAAATQTLDLLLAMTIAEANDCRVLRAYRRKNGHICDVTANFIGMSDDVDACVLLFEHMLVQVAKRCRDGYRDMIRTKLERIVCEDDDTETKASLKRALTKQNPRREYYNGYRYGFITRVEERFKESRTVMLSLPTGRDLTTCKQARVDEYVENNIAIGRSYRPRPMAISDDGYDTGRKDGGKIGIGLDEVADGRPAATIAA